MLKTAKTRESRLNAILFLHRGGRGEVDAGRIESFEGAPARNHGPGDRRGVIVDADDDDADDDDDLEL